MKILTIILLICTSHSLNANSCNNSKAKSLGILWSGAEHIQLGDSGFLSACKEFGVFESDCMLNVIPRFDKKISMTYGQIVAMGDFYKTVDRAYYSDKSTSKIAKVFKCMDKEGKVHYEQQTHPEVEYPDCTWVNILNSSEYLKLVSTNYNHFSWNNIKEYILLHEQALQLALLAKNFKENNKLIEAKTTLEQALFTNAFADHFLTDAFPAGHLRVPRIQLKKWAKRKLSGFLSSYKGDALAAILHDNDSKDSDGQEIGILVRNSLGDEWVTKSDENLNVCASSSSPIIKIPVNSVKASVTELLNAYYYGQTPENEFTAIAYVPFPVGDKLGDLRTRLKPKLRKNLKRLHKSLPLPLRLITSKRDIKKMLKALPSIMKNFREDINKDIKSSKLLKQRIPQAYIDAFSNIK